MSDRPLSSTTPRKRVTLRLPPQIERRGVVPTHSDIPAPSQADQLAAFDSLIALATGDIEDVAVRFPGTLRGRAARILASLSRSFGADWPSRARGLKTYVICPDCKVNQKLCVGHQQHLHRPWGTMFCDAFDSFTAQTCGERAVFSTFDGESVCKEHAFLCAFRGCISFVTAAGRKCSQHIFDPVCDLCLETTDAPAEPCSCYKHKGERVHLCEGCAKHRTFNQ